MRKIITFFICTVLTFNLLAQSPDKMSYQAVVRNNSDELIVNQKVGIQISIIQTSASGDEVYVEEQSPTTNNNGLVSFEIGGDDETIISGGLSIINVSCKLPAGNSSR